MSGGLIISLQQIINNSNMKNDIDYKISEYILKNTGKERLTISEIAKNCHVSKASVTRFAQNIGYDGFHDLKSDFDNISFEREELKIDFKAKSPQNNDHKLTHELKKEFEQVALDLIKFNEEINFVMIQKLCQLIADSENVYIISNMIPEKLSQNLQFTLLHSGKMTYSFPSIRQQNKIVEELTDKDLVLFVSLEGSHVAKREVTLPITTSAATTVLLTQNPEMKLSSFFDHIITMGDHDIERSGKYKLLLFIEYFSHFYLKNHQ